MTKNDKVSIQYLQYMCTNVLSRHLHMKLDHNSHTCIQYLGYTS